LPNKFVISTGAKRSGEICVFFCRVLTPSKAPESVLQRVDFFNGLQGQDTSCELAIRVNGRQNTILRPIVTARAPPMVPVTEPKFAPLFGQPPAIVAEAQERVPVGSTVGILVVLPVPL
jgi:hypothetical protein